MHAYFETEKFRQELDDDEIGVVVLGGDCVEWLRARLEGHEGIVVELPIWEDWGWTMAVSVDGSRLWVNVQDWSFEKAHCWHLWIEPRGFAARIMASRHSAARTRARNVIDEVLSGDPAISEVRWSEESPG
jgi:hypothetical protein